ncbi:MAG: discoidin domain-containing protein [Planctomycetota bacterium]
MPRAARFPVLLALALPATASAGEFRSSWGQSPDRVWLGADTWANPMEDWRLRDGKAECISAGPNRNVVLLTRHLAEPGGGFSMSVLVERVSEGKAGAAGFRIGIKDRIDDYRAAALRGKGLDCGVTAGGGLFIGSRKTQAVTRHGLDRREWRIRFADSTQGGAEAPQSALDGDPSTFWHSKYGKPPYPHELQVDFGRTLATTGMGYLPRQDSKIGRFKDYEIYLSSDAATWGRPVAAGAFTVSEKLQRVSWKPAEARYLRLVMKSDHMSRPAACVAELYVFGPDGKTPAAPPPPAIPEGPWLLSLNGVTDGDGLMLDLELREAGTGKRLAFLEKQRIQTDRAAGALGLFHQGTGGASARFAFSDWTVAGEGVRSEPERAWGPILWAMHTLSNSRGPEGHVLKLTAQMAPLGGKDNRSVELQVRRGEAWETAGREEIDPRACTARFRVARWSADRDVPYRVMYLLKGQNAPPVECVYTGTVRRDPVDRPLIIAGFTGNTDYVFPNLEIARNVAVHDPDVLFFSGDQIYENVGGYGIIRNPPDRSILNYLRKWYLLGWAFGDLMRDRVTISLPDDHDVYQGNIWGAGGIDPGGMKGLAAGGYAQPVEMVDVVHRTQTSHHPDPYDPAPIARAISAYYGDMLYGRVSFAVLADRMFKSGPQNKVNSWRGRPDHVKSRDVDVAALDKPGLQLLGERQEKFLEAWAADWRGADMKIALSQTIFCNLANYHGGGREFIIADLDSNGWPQSGRNRALELLRKGCAFHYAGDQHLASIVHHGIDSHRDAGWSFCVPSIAAGYPRSWLPDKEGRPVKNRPAPGLPNTGDYLDGLGNRVSVFAIGNPADRNRRDSPAHVAHDKASGYGIVRMDQAEQTITMECWRLLIDANDPQPGDQFPGWPRTIHQFENDGRVAAGYLPELTFAPRERPVVQVIDEADGRILYTVRVNRPSFRPKVFRPGSYTVRIGDPDRGEMRTIERIRSADATR